MNIRVLVYAFLLSLAIAAGNNVFNGQSVPWLGTPEVLQKPPGWPSTGNLLKGAWSGVVESWELFARNFWVVAASVGGAGVFAAGARTAMAASWRSIASTVLRIGFAIMFLAACLPKLADPQAFSTLVAQYQFLPSFSVYPFSLWMPAFELVAAVGLLATRWTREFSFLILVMMGMFIVALTQALVRELGITCGCFDVEGVQTTGEAWFALLRDLVLLPPLVWMVRRGKNAALWNLKDRD